MKIKHITIVAAFAAMCAVPRLSFAAAQCQFSGDKWDRSGCVIIWVSGSCTCADIRIGKTGRIQAHDSNGNNCYAGYAVAPFCLERSIGKSDRLDEELDALIDAVLDDREGR